jgi:hypothetical protein
MMEAVSTPETSVNVYQTTRCNIPEDRHLHTRRLENLKSHHDVYMITRINKWSTNLNKMEDRLPKLAVHCRTSRYRNRDY